VSPSDSDPPPPGDAPTAALADISVGGRAMRVIPAGPDFSEQEGNGIARMIDAALAAPDAGAVRFLVLDFARVTFMNSSGIGSCLTIHKGAKDRKKKVIVCGLSKDITDVFRAARLDKLFKIAEDEEKVAKWTG